MSELNTVPLLENVVYDGFDFAIKMPYFAGGNDVIKQYKNSYGFIGEKDSPWYRYWKLRRQLIDDQGEELFQQLLDQAAIANEGKNIRIHESMESINKKLTQAKINCDPSLFVGHLQEQIYPLKDGNIALMGSFHLGIIALVKKMGAIYLSAMKAWKVVGFSAQALKNNLITELALRDEQVEIKEGVFDIVEDALYQAPKPKEVGISVANSAQPEESATIDEESASDVYLAVTEPIKSSWLSDDKITELIEQYELYPYQKDGVRHLVTNTSALLADDMGLGKTRQAVVAAKILLDTHERTDTAILIVCPASLVINWSREIKMVVPDATIAQQKYDPAAKWVIVNYEMLNQVLPHANRFLVVITDECHYLKENNTNRTRLAFEIAAQVPVRFLLTGTPVMNREAEIHTLLRLSGHPIGNIPLKQFENDFCGSFEFRKQLNEKIKAWMLRRKKDVALPWLKGKQEQIEHIKLDPEIRAEYDAIANNRLLYPLPKINKLRIFSDSAKIDLIIARITESSAEDKVLVFTEFKETVFAIRDKLAELGIKAVTLTGDDSLTKRQKAVDEFQNDPNIKCFIGTTAAAGVGINLTAANLVIFSSLPWNPALKGQAEDRAYRNGQLRVVIVKILLIEDSIDTMMWNMIQFKQDLATDILNPEEQEAKAKTEFVKAMTQDAIKKASQKAAATTN